MNALNEVRSITISRESMKGTRSRGARQQSLHVCLGVFYGLNEQLAEPKRRVSETLYVQVIARKKSFRSSRLRHDIDALSVQESRLTL